ncbi:hypothetical protein [Rhodococcus sp. SGAir0479]|uniref:hypothetical protein n=1 Tax=Rhodococcus sp. SGAir0479 TaxID=2567884 RepID=UPI0010CCE5B0|nr:hypothetical protein [Rhodococcus sp. SGAir0479]QCQ92290.1 hypothetical protein E7742_14395 [Rhodococcus sp. SGAir0479]
MTVDRERPEPEHRRPEDVTDATVDAVGKLSEALETVEQARGHLYAFHQLLGRADLQLGEAVEKLIEAGHPECAERLQSAMVGRNVIEGRWTFQLVEEFDDGYWSEFREHEKAVRETLVQGRRHLLEAEMKEARRTHGRDGHEARPGPGR